MRERIFVPFDSRSAEEQRIIMEYIDSGAGSGEAVRANERAWSEFAIVPRVLQTAGTSDTSWRGLGRTWASPVLVAPTGGHGFFAADAEVATSRAACAAGSPVVVSHVTPVPIEQVAAATDSYLQQIYIPRDRAAIVPFVERCVAAGVAGFLVTVDNQAPGTHAYRANAAPLLHELRQDSASRGLESGFADDLSIDDIAWLVSLTELPVLAKGVLDARDAGAIVRAGAAGVVVSNHGGRQIERSVTAARVLAGIREEVGPEPVILADGGIRSAADVFVARSLGADAVMVGRPILHALAADGEAAVEAYLTTMRSDLAELLASAGRRRFADVGADATVSVPAEQARQTH